MLAYAEPELHIDLGWKWRKVFPDRQIKIFVKPFGSSGIDPLDQYGALIVQGNNQKTEMMISDILWMQDGIETLGDMVFMLGLRLWAPPGLEGINKLDLESIIKSKLNAL